MSLDPGRLEVRPLDADSFDQLLAIAEIAEEAPRWSRAHYEDLLSGSSLFPDQPSRPRVALVAQDTRSGEVFGFVIAGLVGTEAELESIAVVPPARRRGIGRLLLASLVTRLRTAGTAELYLEVRASNLGALGFYQAGNFKRTGVRPRYYADPEEDAVLMTLHLG
jgi:ribosomal-protein-alanine N-acetyltransferase